MTDQDNTAQNEEVPANGPHDSTGGPETNRSALTGTEEHSDLIGQNANQAAVTDEEQRNQDAGVIHVDPVAPPIGENASAQAAESTGVDNDDDSYRRPADDNYTDYQR